MARCTSNVLVVSTWAVTLALGSPAFAQSGATAAAEQLFQDGKKLLDAGKTHEACEKFAASQEADPGLGTLLHLASCHEKEGKTASAWAEFSDAMAQAENHGEKDREKYAREHVQALDKQLHKVVLEMPKRPDGLALKLDGKAIPVGSLGTAFPMDPGAHALEISAPRKKTATQTLRVGAGVGSERVVLAELVDEPTAAPTSSRLPDAAQRDDGSRVADGGTPPDTTKRWVGVGLGASGIALGVVAGVELATAASRDKTSTDDGNNARNPPPNTTAADWVKASQDAHTQAVTAQTFGIIFGAAGVVSLGVGIYLFATSFGAQAKARTGGLELSPIAGRGISGLSLSGEL
jgi:hypothetical protein